ncbi:MAG TPA: hypothetical protein VFH24_01575 [Gemmatimonadales bacterium]|nr:hypothetical protein [Gemmatimonadales bacterium]
MQRSLPWLVDASASLWQRRPDWVTRAGRRTTDTAAALLFLGAVGVTVASGLAVVYVLGRSGIYKRHAGWRDGDDDRRGGAVTE